MTERYNVYYCIHVYLAHIFINFSVNIQSCLQNGYEFTEYFDLNVSKQYDIKCKLFGYTTFKIICLQFRRNFLFND